MFKDRIFQLMWVFTEKFGLVFLSIVSFYVFALKLSPDQLGKGVLALSIVELVGLILTSALEDPFVRQKELDSEKDGTLFWSSISIAIICAVLIISGVYIFNHDAGFIALVAFATLKLPVLLASRVFVAHLRRDGKFKSLMVRTLFGKVLGALVGILVAFLGGGPWAIVTQAFVLEAVALLILISVDRRKLPLVINFPFLKDLLSVGILISFKAISWDIMGRGVNLVLGLVAGAPAVGVFNMAQRLVDLPRSSIYGGLASYALPVLSRRQDDKSRLGHFFIQATEHTHLFLLPCFLGMAFVADDLIVLIFGEKWLAAVPVLQLLATVAAFSSIFVFTSSLLMAVKKPQLTLKAEIIGSIIAVLSIFFFGQNSAALGAHFVALGHSAESVGLSLGMGTHYASALANGIASFGQHFGVFGGVGAIAGAIALLIRFMLVFVPNINAINKITDIGYGQLIKAVFPTYLACACMCGVVATLNHYYQYDVIMFVAKILAGGLTYLIALFIFNRFWLVNIKNFITNA